MLVGFESSALVLHSTRQTIVQFFSLINFGSNYSCLSYCVVFRTKKQCPNGFFFVSSHSFSHCFVGNCRAYTSIIHIVPFNHLNILNQYAISCKRFENRQTTDFGFLQLAYLITIIIMKYFRFMLSLLHFFPPPLSII